MEILPSNDENYRPTGKDENRLEHGDLLTNLLDKETGRLHTSRESLVDNQSAPKPTLEQQISRSELKEIMESTMTHLVDKLNTRIVQKTEKLLITTIESFEEDHIVTFARSAKKSYLKDTDVRDE